MLLVSKQQNAVDQEKNLRVQLEEERHEIEILLEEKKKFKSQLDEMMARERKLVKESTALEKSLAMLKHDLREVNENSQKRKNEFSLNFIENTIHFIRIRSRLAKWRTKLNVGRKSKRSY